MNLKSAKKLIKMYLDDNNILYTKLSAKTVDFTDLSRSRCIFVKIHGWQPNPIAANITQLAKDNGFRVEFTQ